MSQGDKTFAKKKLMTQKAPTIVGNIDGHAKRRC
jgi:hypothetical protein